jgi:hypothetical protein
MLYPQVGYTGNTSRLLLGEVVARTLKNLLRKQLRELLKRSGGQAGISESMFVAETVAFLNRTTGGSDDSRVFLAGEVVRGARERFGQQALTEDEAADLLGAVGPPYGYPLIIERLLECVGVTLSEISR